MLIVIADVPNGPSVYYVAVVGIAVFGWGLFHYVRGRRVGRGSSKASANRAAGIILMVLATPVLVIGVADLFPRTSTKTLAFRERYTDSSGPSRGFAARSRYFWVIDSHGRRFKASPQLWSVLDQEVSYACRVRTYLLLEQPHLLSCRVLPGGSPQPLFTR